MARITFGTGLPGVNLYPPVAQPWESTMSTTDFQAIARAADDLGFDSISIPEHIVVPTEMVELMGSFWSHAMTALAFVAGATTRLIVDSSVIAVPSPPPSFIPTACSRPSLPPSAALGSSSAERPACPSSPCLGDATYHRR